MSVVEKVREIVEPILTENNVDLYEVTYTKEGKDYFLRLFINCAGGVDLEKCVTVTELVSPLLDEHDPIPSLYYLEVSSIGAEREIKGIDNIKKAVSSYVYIKTYEKIDNLKEFQGDLIDTNDEEVTITIKVKTKEKTVIIPISSIALIRHAIKF